MADQRASWGDWDDDDHHHPVRPRPRMMPVCGVTNFDDDVALTRRLHTLTGPYRAIVRPTPGNGAGSLVWDVPAALGKNPAVVRREGLTVPDAWAAAAAWITADHIRDVFVDRAHRVTDASITDLTTLADATGTTLWLIWGAQRANVDRVVGTLRRERRRVTLMGSEGFHQAWPLADDAPTWLPLRNPEHTPWPEHGWPVLPAADFPHFRAICRRLLAGDTFHALDAHYRDEFHRTRQWMRHRDPHAPRAHETLPRDLNTHLRDQRLGPADDPGLALIRLRAIQAALLREDVLLRWNPDPLGPAPATRLLTALTRRVCSALRTSVDTGPAAAVVLALHLGEGPENLVHLSLRNVDENGRHVLLAETDEETRSLRAQWAARVGTDLGPAGPKVTLPAYAGVIVAAHLARRRADLAPPTAPFFTDPRDPTEPASTKTLRDAILRTCRRIHHNPAWLHGDENCRHGDDIGMRPSRRPGWMLARGLECHILRPEDQWDQ